MIYVVFFLQISTGNSESPSASKCSALQQLIETSISSDPSIWTKV